MPTAVTPITPVRVLRGGSWARSGSGPRQGPEWVKGRSARTSTSDTSLDLEETITLSKTKSSVVEFQGHGAFKTKEQVEELYKDQV